MLTNFLQRVLVTMLLLIIVLIGLAVILSPAQ